MISRKISENKRNGHVYRFNGKYNSTLEERIKKTPKGNIDRGTWTGDRGESWYIPTEKSIKNILHTFKLGGILYREGIPDFSLCAKITVSIENMSEIRRENFQDSVKFFSQI